jgi:hypothetical protein
MSEERALKDGLRPKAKLIDWIFTSQAGIVEGLQLTITRRLLAGSERGAFVGPSIFYYTSLTSEWVSRQSDLHSSSHSAF